MSKEARSESQEATPQSATKKPQSNNSVAVVAVLVAGLAAVFLIGNEYKRGDLSLKPQLQEWHLPPPPTPRPVADVQRDLDRASKDPKLTGMDRDRFLGYLSKELERSKAVEAGQPDPAMVEYQQKVAAMKTR